MTVRIYVPRDAAALALGAEKVAKALAGEIASRNLDVTIVRCLLVPATVALLGELNWWRPQLPARWRRRPVDR